MSWTIIQEDEDGNEVMSLSKEFRLSNTDVIYNEKFRLLKYLDPWGDTTFNRQMLKDLISDLIELKKLTPTDAPQIDELIALAFECDKEPHNFLKFYGD